MTHSDLLIPIYSFRFTQSLLGKCVLFRTTQTLVAASLRYTVVILNIECLDIFAWQREKMGESIPESWVGTTAQCTVCLVGVCVREWERECVGCNNGIGGGFPWKACNLKVPKVARFWRGSKDAPPKMMFLDATKKVASLGTLIHNAK